MFETECCICGEIAKSPYVSIKHLESGMSRIYSGHKGCLNLLDTRLSNGYELKYSEYDRTKLLDKKER